MFTANAYPFYKNDKSTQQSGGIGPVLRLRLEEKRAFKEATQVIYNGHFRCCRIKSIISIFEMKLKFLPIDFLPFYFAMVSLKSIN
jgi:hypothetical protein